MDWKVGDRFVLNFELMKITKLESTFITFERVLNPGGEYGMPLSMFNSRVKNDTPDKS